MYFSIYLRNNDITNIIKNYKIGVYYSVTLNDSVSISLYCVCIIYDKKAAQ